MNIISLFDGISCLQLALKDAGIEYDNYFASEINKDAIKVTQHNFPNTIQLGDVRGIDFNSLPEMDLIGCGSPCQDISGLNNNGKGLAGQKSSLFYYFKKARERWPNAKFIVEQVQGKDSKIISRELKIRHMKLNSLLVAPQKRNRLYWSNILVRELPKKSTLLLKDILQQSVDSKYYQSEKWLKWWEKNNVHQMSHSYSSLNADYAYCLTARMYASWQGNYWRDEKGIRRLTPIECERLQTIPDGYTSIISDNKAYEAIGNGWTVKIISHILKYMK